MSEENMQDNQDLNDLDRPTALPSDTAPAAIADEATGAPTADSAAEPVPVEASAPVSDKPKKVAPKKAFDKVDYKLDQEDDEARENTHDPLSVAVIKEAIASTGDWESHFDPQAGFKPREGETEAVTTPSKITRVVPVMVGPAKDAQHQVINGVKQYKPKTDLVNFKCFFQEDKVNEALNGFFPDAVSKYMLEHMLKPWNKLVFNEHYDRKMPTRSLNGAFRVSLGTVEEISGVSFKDFLHATFRAGWYRKSAAKTKFDLAAMCQTPQQIEHILKDKGETISKWKNTDFPTLHVQPAVFKRIGAIVASGFTKGGALPHSDYYSAILDCIAQKQGPYETSLEGIQGYKEQEAAGLIPAGTVTPQHLKVEEQIKKELTYWATVTCGLEAQRDEQQKKELKKLAKLNSGVDTSLTGLDELTDIMNHEEFTFLPEDAQL